jgi:hypothetical protein
MKKNRFVFGCVRFLLRRGSQAIFEIPTLRGAQGFDRSSADVRRQTAFAA